MRTENDVYKLLSRAYQLVYNGEWWDITGFNEAECYLEHCEDHEECAVPLKDLVSADFYELKLIKEA